MEYRKRNLYEESLEHIATNIDYKIDNYKILEVPESQALCKYLSNNDYSLVGYSKDEEVYSIVVSPGSYDDGESIMLISIDLMNWYEDKVDISVNYESYHCSEVDDIYII